MLETAERAGVKLFLYAFLGASVLSGASAQQQTSAPGGPPAARPGGAAPDSATPDVQEIIGRFAAKEKEFKAARDNYTYRQVVKVEELSGEGDVTGTYQMQEDVIFTPQGERVEKVVFAPMSTLRHISLSPEDEKDLRNVQPFVLTTDDLNKYNIQFQGRQKVDELGTFVFMVSPKVIEKNQRYFEGQIWVDDRDGKYQKLTPALYGAVIDEAHKNGLRVTAHIFKLDDAKGLLKAGVDAFPQRPRQGRR